jgi:putative ABC transport system permease protein
LSYDLWRSRFAGDPALVGKTVVLDGEPRTIVGILPKQFPKFNQEQIYAPLVFESPESSKRGERFLAVLGRIRHGVSLATARQRMSEVSGRLGRQFEEDAEVSASLQPIEEAYVEEVQGLVLVPARSASCC